MAAMESESIYNRIKGAMTADGVMPEGFALRERLPDGRQFADGAIDGAIRYYMGPANNTDTAMLEQALKLASDGRFEDAANGLITYFSRGIVMLPVMDKVQEWVYAHSGELAPDRLGQFVMLLLLQSRDVESVKFALTILEVLDREPDDELRGILLTLAACEELTLFCLFALGGFEDANEVYFQLAKKLRGWGRIHAVSMLKPAGREMRDWLLREGWRNEIMPEYSAMAVIRRTKLVDLLRQPEGGALLDTAGTLIGYSLQDEPVAGLAGYKRVGELLRVYLEMRRQAGQSALTAETAEHIRAVRAFLEQHELADKWQLVELCNNLLED